MSTPAEESKHTASARLDDWLENTFSIVTEVLLAAVGIALLVLSVMALWDTVVLVHNEITTNHDLTKAITVGVDTVFLTVILLELLHTVIARGSLSQQAPEFIIIGITSAIRHGLGLVASSSGSAETVQRIIHGHKYDITVPGSGNPRDTVINLAINAVGVLVLVAALWLVRHGPGRNTEAATD